MLKQIFKIMIAGILSILVLSPIAVFYSYDGAHRINPTESTDVCWYPNQWKGTMAEGIAFMRLDSNGFNNNYELDNQNINILLMGSSHMEALQVSQSKNTGALLNELLPEYTTYNISISGHTIYHCVDNLEAAMAEYSPSDYVIIETMNIKLDSNQMQTAMEHNRSRSRSSTGGSYYLARFVPGLNTIYQKITNWKNSSKLSSSTSESDIIQESLPSAQYESDLQSFLSYAENTVSSSGCKLIILYHPTMEIEKDGKLILNTDPDYLSCFKNVCEEENITFVDMSEDFFDMYNRSHTLPYGFSNTEVATGHLNIYGHEAIASKLQEIITALGR